MNGVWNLRAALALMFVCISFDTPFFVGADSRNGATVQRCGSRTDHCAA